MLKNVISTVILISVFFVAQAFATIYHVNSNPGSQDADFTTLQAAHDGASDGDTLYCYGSSISYGDVTFTKKLCVIGPGYFLGENGNLRANTGEAKTGEISFNAGSEGTLFTGMYVCDHKVYINTSSITFKRNRINTYVDGYNNSGYVIELAGDVSNIIIAQNYMVNTCSYGGSYDSPRVIGIRSGDSNVTITNNYLKTYSVDKSKEAIKCESSSIMNITISHNVLHGTLEAKNANVNHNILLDGYFWYENASYTYNIGDDGQFGSENGNFTASSDTLFVGTGSSDGKWQLKEGSPAIGAGYGGVDIGMFGGSTPYKLSGIVALPSIYFFQAPSVVGAQSEFEVNLKIRSND